MRSDNFINSLLPVMDAGSPSSSTIARRRKRLSVCAGVTISALCFQAWMQLVTSPNGSDLRTMTAYPKFINRASNAKIEGANSQSANSFTISETSDSRILKNATGNESPCKPLKPLQWEFQKFSQDETKNQLESKLRQKAKKRLLIGMYSGFDSYAKLLDITASVNKAYAQKWGQDTVVLQGVAMHLGDLDGGYGCTPKPGVRPAFNKIKILEYALNHTDEYDQLLLVDTDAMVFDLDFDITTMVDDDVMLVAHRVHEDAPARGNWDVNNGVTLWNLKHNETAGVVADWDRYARKSLSEFEGVGGDQHQLHKAIKYGFGYERVDNRIAAVKATYGEFFYGHGSVVRHFIRNNNNVKELGWKAPNPLDRRIYRLNKARRMICESNPSAVCESIQYVRYGEGDYDIWSMGQPPQKVVESSK